MREQGEGTKMEQSKLFESQEQKAGAEFSKDRKYRYRLWREWNKTKPAVLFVMLNPSTADELVLDSTVSRCLSFAKEWGYGRLEVANLFALRATDPKELNKVEDPVGGVENDVWIRWLSQEANLTVAAWGTHGGYLGRDVAVWPMLKEPHCLAISKEGYPKHPLYLNSEIEAFPYNGGKY